jgi:hypothetical protein
MTPWCIGLLLLLASLEVAGCPICLGAYRSSLSDQLVDARRVVLVDPASNRHAYRIAAVIKGAPPEGGVIDGVAVALRFDTVFDAKQTMLLVNGDEGSTWQVVGAAKADHAGWLRHIAAGKRSADMGGAEWQGRVALMLPYLEHREPLVAQIAYSEVAAAPYEALLAAKPRLSAPAIRRWLFDPALAQRESLYLLLIGIAGDARDAAALERRLDAAWAARDKTSLASLIAADLELRGPARLAWVEERYLADRKRTSAEIEAALMALSVQGNADRTIPRQRVIAAYRSFIAARPDIAGYVARDLASWQHWDAVPQYVALVKSATPQQYPSKIAILDYLRQSPAAATIDPSLVAVSPR